MRIFKKIIIFVVIFVFFTFIQSCILGESDSSIELKLSNITDVDVLIVTYPSISKKKYGSIDTIFLSPYDSYIKQCGGMGQGCGRPTFSFYFNKSVIDIDSIAFIFNEEKRIVFIRDGYCFCNLEEFWTVEGRSEEVCIEQKWKRYTTYQLTYFFTDEMYEQATPIL